MEGCLDGSFVFLCFVSMRLNPSGRPGGVEQSVPRRIREIPPLRRRGLRSQESRGSN